MDFEDRLRDAEELTRRQASRQIDERAQRRSAWSRRNDALSSLGMEIATAFRRRHLRSVKAIYTHGGGQGIRSQEVKGPRGWRLRGFCVCLSERGVFYTVFSKHHSHYFKYEWRPVVETEFPEYYRATQLSLAPDGWKPIVDVDLDERGELVIVGRQDEGTIPTWNLANSFAELAGG